jgi:hypothetical protein
MNDKQLEYVVEVLEREVSGYSDEFIPERIKLIKNYIMEYKIENPSYFTELYKCANDILYFARKYVKINNHFTDEYFDFVPYPYQERMLKHLSDSKHSICKIPRQSGKDVVSIVIILHTLIFNGPASIFIANPKRLSSNKFLKRFYKCYDALPEWMKDKVTINNESEIIFENGSGLYTSGNTVSKIRSRCFNLVLLNEYAFFFGNNDQHDEYWKVINISAGAKLMILSTTSTTDKNQYFNKLWLDSVCGKNNFSPFTSHWSEVPGRDQEWKNTMIQNMDLSTFNLEFETVIDL